LASEIGDFIESKNSQDFLDALDAFYMNFLSKKFSYGSRENSIMGILSAEIDRKNVMAMLRGIQNNVQKEKLMGFVVFGGSIPAEKLEKLSSQDSLEKAVEFACRELDLSFAKEKFLKEKKLSVLEMELEKKIARKSLSALRKSVLSAGTIIGFLILKENEAKNIRKIVRAKEFGLDKMKTEEMLVRA
jgi:vacuolar-type H+-ATPase subunit C/Vma6